MAFLCRDIARLQTDLHIDGNLQQLRLVKVTACRMQTLSTLNLMRTDG